MHPFNKIFAVDVTSLSTQDIDCGKMFRKRFAMAHQNQLSENLAVSFSTILSLFLWPLATANSHESRLFYRLHLWCEMSLAVRPLLR